MVEAKFPRAAAVVSLTILLFPVAVVYLLYVIAKNLAVIAENKK